MYMGFKKSDFLSSHESKIIKIIHFKSRVKSYKDNLYSKSLLRTTRSLLYYYMQVKKTVEMGRGEQ